nr:hypothetical protein CFP56_14624 [Quercus suber]
MAFQQPQQRPQPSRPLSFTPPVVDSAPAISPARKRSLAESQEWILFSPQTDDDQSRTSQTPRTATHLSDFGSLETHIRSQVVTDPADAELNALGSDFDDDGAELDSLDDGLHAFHHPFSTSSNHLDQSGGAILPTHDGLGAFPSSDGLQEQLWQFERHNPHRRRSLQRRSSAQPQLDVMKEGQEDATSPVDERTARIEQWRLEQSKAVLEEIEREARRRRRQMSRMASSVGTIPSLRENAATAASQQTSSGVAPGSEDDVQQPNESFWRRITRRVIEDLIGLDETTLSVIFGEQLVDDPSPTPTKPSPLAAAASRESRLTLQRQTEGWEIKLMERIARELGILVNHFSEHPPGAFSTYVRTALQEPDYAGIPASDTSSQPTPPPRLQRRFTPHRRSSDPAFAPTLAQTPISPSEQTDTSLWGIEEEPAAPGDATFDADRLHQQREYWERDVDVKMVFQYLKTRFSAGSSSTPPPPQPNPGQSSDGPLPASWVNSANTGSALGTSPESLRRAEVIRRQHPLVSRAAAKAQQRRRESLLRRHHVQTLLQKRTGGSSCASHSTRRSRHTRSGSSRHYWDLGGSVGSGSGPAISSGLGGWGEV